MADAAFTADGVTPLIFSVNPSYPGRLGLGSGRVRGKTEGGEDYLYTKGKAYVLYTLRFEGMPARDFDGGYDYAAGVQEGGSQSLVNWFVSVAADGAEFTYSDPFGGTHQVTLADTVLEFTLTDNGLYDGALTLRETVG
ncbi:MAG: hypothetical protein HZC51_01495 [Nitrospirae bacterium]|nr:hypothetical protein [Nitrospirota bacterium]